MEVATVPQIEKHEYRNQTNGWVGVVVLDGKGEEQGVNIEPLGTIWLSDAEVILTARAPRRREDNPFEEQPFIMQDEFGKRSTVMMRPVVRAPGDSRYVPSMDRYIPPMTDDGLAVQAETAAHDPEQPVSPAAAAASASVLAAQVDRNPEQQPILGTPQPPPQTLKGTGGSPATAPDESWTTPPKAPGAVLAGSLRGAQGPSPEAAAAAAPDPTLAPAAPSVAPQRPVAPAPPQEEEHASVEPRVGDETGAAQPPTGEPVEGEFGTAEEVGSPNAPTQVSPEPQDQPD